MATTIRSAVSRTIFVAGFIWEERSLKIRKIDLLTCFNKIECCKDKTKGGFVQVFNYNLTAWLKRKVLLYTWLLICKSETPFKKIIQRYSAHELFLEGWSFWIEYVQDPIVNVSQISNWIRLSKNSKTYLECAATNLVHIKWCSGITPPCILSISENNRWANNIFSRSLLENAWVLFKSEAHLVTEIGQQLPIYCLIHRESERARERESERAREH